MGYILFFLTIICSVFSQHPAFLGTSVAAILKYSWSVPFLYNVFVYGRCSKYHRIIKTYVFFGIFFIIYDIVFVPKTNLRLDSDVVNVLISFVVLVTSYLFWLNKRNEKFLIYMCVALLLSVLYVGYIIYSSSLSVVSLDDMEYACGSKNSIATIILSTVVWCFFNMNFSSKILTYLSYISYAFLIVIMFLLKSRATLLGFIFLVFYVSTKYKKKKIRNIIAMCVCFLVFYILYDPEVYDMLINKIFLNNRSVDDLNAVSSGRDEQIAAQWDRFEDNFVFGTGGGYIDSFPIQILTKYGIVGFVFMYVFLCKISKKVFDFSRDNKLQLSSFLLLCIFLLNSLFEAYPPFGPGIKCCFLWISIGFSCAEITISKYYFTSNQEDNESRYFCGNSYDE